MAGTKKHGLHKLSVTV